MMYQEGINKTQRSARNIFSTGKTVIYRIGIENNRTTLPCTIIIVRLGLTLTFRFQWPKNYCMHDINLPTNSIEALYTETEAKEGKESCEKVSARMRYRPLEIAF